MFRKLFSLFKKKDTNPVLTEKSLKLIDDNELEIAVFNNVSQIIGSMPGDEVSCVRRLSAGQQAMYAAWMIEGQVNNGGFNQFYYNSYDRFSKMGISGFELFGLYAYADLVRRADELYLSMKSHLQQFNDGTIEGFSRSYENNPLNDLDDEFYELERQASVSEARIKYIRLNPEEFINSGN